MRKVASRKHLECHLYVCGCGYPKNCKDNAPLVANRVNISCGNNYRDLYYLEM